TVGPGHGKVLFDSFTFKATVVQVSNKGKVSLPDDPRVSEGKLPNIRITAIDHPDVVANLDVPVRYDIDFKADFSGKAGADGANGASGLDGSNGGQPGWAGGDGGPGGDGQNGGDGEPGKAVHVWFALKSGSRPLLQARVLSGADEKLFLIDPNGGSLEVDTNGGPGGKGGAGGKGGRGGAGGAAEIDANGKETGIDGPNGQAGGDGLPGQPGQGGAAGTILVSVDPQAQPFLNKLHLSNNSGSGMPGDAPDIRIEPVPAIW
ncbi:MAG: hypothetical protein ABSE59_03165, partial [Opitutaceae bacterium]